MHPQGRPRRASRSETSREGEEGGSADRQVDNTKLGAGTNPYTFHTGPSAKPLSEGSVAIQSEEVLVKGTLDLIRRDHTHRLLVDFDDHLEDPYV
jgi:hypothetical protein